MVTSIIILIVVLVLQIQKKAAEKKAAQAVAAEKAAKKAAEKAAKEKVKKLKTYLGKLSYQFLNQWMVGEDILRATVEKGLKDENRLGFYLIMEKRFEKLAKSGLGERQKANKSLFNALLEGELTLKPSFAEIWEGTREKKVFFED